jgi:hypothetical protein
MVISIPRPLKEKVGLFGIFGLGFITVTAAGFRLQFLHNYTISSDPFFDTLPIHIWSMVEVHIGILCASLPTLRPLLSKAQRGRTRLVNGIPVDGDQKGTTMVTSGTIAIVMGATIRGSYRPPVPPKSPSYAGSNTSSSPTYAPSRDSASPIYKHDYNSKYDYNSKLSPVWSSGHPSPLFSNRDKDKTFEADLERNASNGTQPKRLALLKRDENGIFRPEAVYRPT